MVERRGWPTAVWTTSFVCPLRARRMAQPLVGNPDLFSSKPKTNSASSRHHILHRRPRHDKRCFRCLNLRGRLAARSRAAVAARRRPIMFVSNVSGVGAQTRRGDAYPQLPGSPHPSYRSFLNPNVIVNCLTSLFVNRYQNKYRDGN